MSYFRILTAILFAVSFAACSSDEEKGESIVVTQQRDIIAYIDTVKNKYPSVVVPNTDEVYQLIYARGSSLKPVAVGDSVIFYYTAAVFDKKKGMGRVYDTNIDTVAQNHHLDLSKDFVPPRALAGKGQFMYGLDKGLLLMSEGERALLIFTSDMGYGSRQVGTVPANSPLVFDVFMHIVKKN